jgi:NAD-dependent DNA ligase
MWRDYQHWLMSLQQMAGVKLAQTGGIKETVAWIASLYSWWQKDWYDHKSVQTVYAPSNVDNGGGPLASIGYKPSLSRLWAMQLPGIGHEKSKVISMAFPSAYELAIATPERWQMVEGIGKTLATRIVGAIRRGQ